MPDGFQLSVTETVDPQVMTTIMAATRLGCPPPDPLTMGVEEARAASRRYHAFLNGPEPLPASVHDFLIEGPTGPIPMRILRPRGAEGQALPVLLYFHGGGFVLNSPDTHDHLLRQLVRRADVAICVPAYSLAPEHQYPHQHHEAQAALRWLRSHGAAHGLDVSRLTVGGDSAGANQALSLALADRGAEGGSAIRAALLFYGMFARDFGTRSHQSYGRGGYGLTSERMRWYWNQYLGDSGASRDPLAVPLLADLHGLPPVRLFAAGRDCLLDDSLRLASALSAAKVPHSLDVAETLPHAYVNLSRLVPEADRALSRAASALRQSLLRA